jgi:hypothetical protein
MLLGLPGSVRALAKDSEESHYQRSFLAELRARKLCVVEKGSILLMLQQPFCGCGSRLQHSRSPSGPPGGSFYARNPT